MVFGLDFFSSELEQCLNTCVRGGLGPSPFRAPDPVPLPPLLRGRLPESACESTSDPGLLLVLLLGRYCGEMSFLVSRQCCDCTHSHSVGGDVPSLVTSSWSVAFCQ